MMAKKEKLFLLVQSGYSARNFILSGFLEQAKCEVVFWSDQNYIQQYGINNELIKLPDYIYNGKQNFIQKIKNKAELFYNVKKFQNKNYLSYLIGITNNKSVKTRIKDAVSTLISKVFSTKKGIEYLDKPFYEITRKTSYYKACKQQLEKNKPTIVLCTHQRASSAVSPMLAARDLGIRTICFIHSWDNIPKGVQLVKADEYFVWSDYMKEEMIVHYPFINPASIKVTGTPQFIPYFQEEYRLSREQFLSQFNLNIHKKYILFSGNDKTSSPNDPYYLANICESVLKLNEQENIYHILFRPNPIDRNDAFDNPLEKYKNIVTEIKPDWFGTNTFLWNKGGPSKNDVILLVNTILHSNLIINVGSTMAVDAALLGKPTCYIRYEVENKYNWSVERAYNYVHFKMIKTINPVFWILKKDKIFDIIKEALNFPEKTLEGRNKWIETITKSPILETNKRMWNYILKSDEV